MIINKWCSLWCYIKLRWVVEYNTRSISGVKLLFAIIKSCKCCLSTTCRAFCHFFSPIISNALFQSSGNLYSILPSRSSINNLPIRFGPLSEMGDIKVVKLRGCSVIYNHTTKITKSGANLIEIYRYNLNNNFFSSSTIWGCAYLI